MNKPLLRRGRQVWVGDREVTTYGLPRQFWQDIYHEALTMRWPSFVAAIAGLFLLINAGFALLFLLGDQAIGNQSPSGFLGALFFSIETLATVGYGNMYPQTIYGHIIATTEIFVGMIGIAVVTGLIFARFSRPRAKVLFARHPVVGPFDRRETLMIRAANARQNIIVDASAKLRLLVTEPSTEGTPFRRLYDLKLVREQHPIFLLGWTVMHVIDATSPLHGATADSLARRDATLILTLSGLDETTVQTLQARMHYRYDSIRWRHKYADLLTLNPGQQTELDYDKFHDVVPL